MLSNTFFINDEDTYEFKTPYKGQVAIWHIYTGISLEKSGKLQGSAKVTVVNGKPQMEEVDQVAASISMLMNCVKGVQFLIDPSQPDTAENRTPLETPAAEDYKRLDAAILSLVAPEVAKLLSAPASEVAPFA